MKKKTLYLGIGGIVLGGLLLVAGRFRYIPFSGLLGVLLVLGGAGLVLYARLIEGKIPVDELPRNIRRNLNGTTLLRHAPMPAFGLILCVYAIGEALSLLALIGFGLFCCGAVRLFRDLIQPDIREDAAYTEQDEQLGDEIIRLQRILSLLRLAMAVAGVAAVAAMIVGGVTGSWVPLIIAGIAGSVVLMVQENYQSKMKAYVADNITRQALEAVFEVSEYRPFGCIDSGLITGKYFGIRSFDDAKGSDYVRGFYHGLPIEMCDMHLTERCTRTDEHGRTEEYNETVFRGFWLICDFGKTLSAELRVWERDRMDKLLGGKGIATENEKFNRKFHIESEIEQEAFYILTPHMMEYILEMDKKANGQTHLRFDRNGKVQIAISTGYDHFEVGKKARNATLLRKQFIEEIRGITAIIDELRLVDTLYQSEGK